MKKFLSLIVVAMMAATGTAQAQTITVNKVDGSKIVYQASEITSIEFNPAESAAEQLAGTYTGADSLSVGGQWSYWAQGLKYIITANADGTVNVQVPEQTFANTVMGDITQGQFTVSNIAYDESRGAFYRSYSGDGLKAHVKTVNKGTTTMDSDYQLNNAEITIKAGEGGSVNILNTYKFGNMPFQLTGTYTGTK